MWPDATVTSSPPHCSVPFANQHPLNQHAFILLRGWNLRPITEQQHILTLASAARFARDDQKAGLAALRTAPPEVTLAHFLSVATFDLFFLSEKRSLEAVHIILAAASLYQVPA